MPKKIYDAVASVGEYTDRNGQTKKRYVNIGAVFESDDGKYMSLKLESIPVGPNWSGWVSFFVPKEREVSPAQQAHNEAKANGYQPGSTKDGGFGGMDDDIPFAGMRGKMLNCI